MIINTVSKVYDTYTSSFSAYKLTYSNGIICIVPLDTTNKDYIEIQKWAAIDGNNITDPGE